MATWLNEPKRWQEVDGVFEVETRAGSDFSRRTHYGFVRYSGHFIPQEVMGDFTATVTVEGDYRTLYDQAGLMVRVDEERWMKCGIEYVDGVQLASVVVTRDYSDWSVTPVENPSTAMRFRVVRTGETLEVSWARAEGDWQMMRTAYLPMAGPVDVGLMAASPGEESFRVTFRDFQISAS